VNWADKIFKTHSRSEFKDLAFDVFNYQINHCEVYSNYVYAIGKTNPNSLNDIPFLPISFFKSKRVISNQFDHIECFFKSSGTLGERSCHELVDVSIYEQSFEWSYAHFVGNIKEHVILGLLPNYIEQGNSSLVYMVDALIKKSGSPSSQFIMNDIEEIKRVIAETKTCNKTLVIFGVAYSLLDLCDQGINLKNAIVIETGGMKGKRKELSKEGLHQKLHQDLQMSELYSEYGMTELLSQAYCKSDFIFETPPWMKIVIRDLYDPLSICAENKRGGINVIDLANIYSCSFIATEDSGLRIENTFQLKGRIERSDLRGCNLLVD
tara:strand:- start:250 stop:1218 length:969 start_codon:yes stop_codon:yes gene_type:complete